MELCSFHNLSGVIHEPDGPGDLHPGVDICHGAHHEPPVVVLHFVLQKGGDADVDVLEEVQNGVSEKGKTLNSFYILADTIKVLLIPTLLIVGHRVTWRRSFELTD